MKKILTGMATALIVATMLMGCKKTIEITGVTISSPEETINVGSTVTLSYTVEPQGAEVESEEWISSDGGVASVDQNGVVTGVAEGTATITITVNGKYSKTCTVTVENPILLQGVFSVSANKKVQFTKGNLYWNGSAFKFENSQTESPAAYSTPLDQSHVGHFFWGKTAAAAYAPTYNGGTDQFSDKFFADGSDADHTLTVDGKGGLYALSKDEWSYLLSAAPAGRGDGDSKFKCDVTVCGVEKCLVIAPDGYTGTIASSYDAAAWSTAESAGLVCLTSAGYRTNSGNGPSSVGSSGYYWSATPSGSDADKAYYVGFGSDPSAAFVEYTRSFGCAIRLVSAAN